MKTLKILFIVIVMALLLFTAYQYNSTEPVKYKYLLIFYIKSKKHLTYFPYLKNLVGIF